MDLPCSGCIQDIVEVSDRGGVVVSQRGEGGLQNFVNALRGWRDQPRQLFFQS